MVKTASLTADELPLADNTRPDGSAFFSGIMPFLFAGAVLFASLVIGSSASLLLAGSNQLIGAILHGFLALGLWAFGASLIAAAAGLAVIAVRRRRA